MYASLDVSCRENEGGGGVLEEMMHSGNILLSPLSKNTYGIISCSLFELQLVI